MTLARTATDGLREHVTLELESIDRMYLNLYVPLLQTPGGVAYYIHEQLGSPMASTVLLAPKGTELGPGSSDLLASREWTWCPFARASARTR